MLQVDISASTRKSFGKGAMRRLRVSGNTPAVLYGNDKDVISLQLETKPFLKTLYQISRKNAVVTLTIDGDDSRQVMMQEVQTDPVTDSLIHADFYEINTDKVRLYSIPVEFQGVAKGVEGGGEMVVHDGTVKVEGLPLDIPDVITVDVTSLEIGDSIKFADIALPDNVSLLSDANLNCVVVTTARVVIEEDEEELADVPSIEEETE